MRREITRRGFVERCARAAGAGALGAIALPALSAKASLLESSDSIRVALIGCGGMGKGDLQTFFRASNRVECALLCDVDDAQIAATIKQIEGSGKARPPSVKDFRRVVEKKDIDVCIVATPDHWHALPTMHACKAGKDVYVEKPLATSIAEGRAMVEAARETRRVVQMGTQWRSGAHYQNAVRYVQSGKLGRIRIVRAWACLDWVRGLGKPADRAPPAGVDYDMWLGPAPKRPFNPLRFHFNFRWFWDYAGGLQTDWGVHLINIAQWAMKVKAPLSVASSGGKYVIDDITETPDTQATTFEFPDFLMLWEHQVDGNHGVRRREHGVAFDGENGTVVVDTSGWEVIPKKGKGLEPAKEIGTPGPRVEHVKNFLACCETRDRPVTDIEIGHYASTTPMLGNIALRTGRKIRWDPNKEEVVGDPEANRLVSKRYREPWSLKI